MQYLLIDTIDAQTMWYFIGLYLNLPPSTLDAMRTNMRTSNEQYAEVLKQWINGGTATVKKLIDALENKAVKQNAIASRLRRKYADRVVAQQGIYIKARMIVSVLFCMLM